VQAATNGIAEHLVRLVSSPLKTARDPSIVRIVKRLQLPRTVPPPRQGFSLVAEETETGFQSAPLQEMYLWPPVRLFDVIVHVASGHTATAPSELLPIYRPRIEPGSANCCTGVGGPMGWITRIHPSSMAPTPGWVVATGAFAGCVVANSLNNLQRIGSPDAGVPLCAARGVRSRQGRDRQRRQLCTALAIVCATHEPLELDFQ